MAQKELSKIYPLEIFACHFYVKFKLKYFANGILEAFQIYHDGYD